MTQTVSILPGLIGPGGPTGNPTPVAAGGVRYNLITFNAGGQRVKLTAQKWVHSAGLKPDLNRATVPKAEFDKIRTDVSQVGSIEFWYSRSPDVAGAQADHTLDKHRVVEVEPGEVRQLVDGSMQPYEFHLQFADARDAYVEPRGGRVKLGLLNAGTHGSPDSDDGEDEDDDSGDDDLDQGDPATDVPELSMSDLIAACLKAMQVADQSVPAVNDTPAPRNIKWFGNHAPSELAKLLQLCNCAFIIDPAGAGHVVKITSEGTPSVSSDAELPGLSMPKVDRRGKTVVFASYPTRIVETKTIDGLGDDTFYFVAQDTDGTWKKLKDVSFFKGDPASAVKNDFAKIDPKYRDRAAEQAYRYLQYSSGDDSGNQPARLGPIFPRRIEKDLSELSIQVCAKVAVRDPSGNTWTNSDDKIDIPVLYVGAGNILQLGRAVGQVKTAGTTTPDTDFQEISDDDLSVRCTIEAGQKDDKGGWQPRYLHLGFQRQANGGITPLGSDDSENAVGQHDTMVVCRPELRLVIVDGNEVNRSALESSVSPMAASYLADASAPTRVLGYRGFASAKLSGLISKIEWDQAAVDTHVTCNDWYAPLGSLNAGELMKIEEATKEPAFPHQGKEQATHTAMGASGSQQQWTPVMPTTPQSYSQPGGISVMMTTQVAGSGGIYNGVLWTAPSAIPKSSSLEIDVSTGQGKACIIVNTLENYRSTHVIPKQKILNAVPSKSQDDGTPTYLVNYDPDCYRKFRVIQVDDGTGTGSTMPKFQGLRTFDYDLPNTGVDWEDLIVPQDPCATPAPTP